MPGPLPYSAIPHSDYLAPVCRVHLSLGDRSVDHDAIIDSGADVTCIPEWIADELLLNQVTEFTITSVNDNNDKEDGDDTPVETRPGYLVDFEFLGFPYRALVVASVKGPTDHILIGRDILSLRELTLSGPTQTFTIE